MERSDHKCGAQPENDRTSWLGAGFPADGIDRANRDLSTIRDVLDHNPDVVLMVSVNGTIQYANHHTLDLFGHSAESLIGKNVQILIPPALREIHQKHLSSVRQSRSASIFGLRREVTGLHQTGRELMLELHVVPWRGGDQQNFIATVRDVGPRVRLEQHRKRLTKRLVRRNRQLRTLRAAAEAADRAKSEFLANMSHEIRTPLTSIVGFADELLAGELTPEERTEFVEIIRRNGQHLLRLVNDILDLAKIESGLLEVEILRFSVRTCVSELESTFRERCHAKGLTFEVRYFNPIPESIESDPFRLRQILWNLLENALKFTDDGSIVLTVSMAASRDPCIRFDVSDSGCGIESSALDRLFRPFTQVDSSTTRKYGGTGLGLTISRRLAEMLGGTITLTSEPGQGSTFSVTINTGLAHSETHAAPLPESLNALDPGAIQSSEDRIRRPLLGLRILVAEDSPDIQRLIAFHLRAAGADVQAVENGRFALQALSVDGTTFGPLRLPPVFDLLLTDMQMPEIDGYELVATLRNKGWSRPIIALTAHALNGDSEKCLMAGCDAHLPKPITKDLLISTLARWAGLHEGLL
ncbi:MAG: ATP-binding protein [Planctomycetaceae bacterium]